VAPPPPKDDDSDEDWELPSASANTLRKRIPYATIAAQGTSGTTPQEPSGSKSQGDGPAYMVAGLLRSRPGYGSDKEDPLTPQAAKNLPVQMEEEPRRVITEFLPPKRVLQRVEIFQPRAQPYVPLPNMGRSPGMSRPPRPSSTTTTMAAMNRPRGPPLNPTVRLFRCTGASPYQPDGRYSAPPPSMGVDKVVIRATGVGELRERAEDSTGTATALQPTSTASWGLENPGPSLTGQGARGGLPSYSTGCLGGVLPHFYLGDETVDWPELDLPPLDTRPLSPPTQVRDVPPGAESLWGDLPGVLASEEHSPNNLDRNLEQLAKVFYTQQNDQQLAAEVARVYGVRLVHQVIPVTQVLELLEANTPTNPNPRCVNKIYALIPTLRTYEGLAKQCWDKAKVHLEILSKIPEVERVDKHSFQTLQVIISAFLAVSSSMQQWSDAIITQGSLSRKLQQAVEEMSRLPSIPETLLMYLSQYKTWGKGKGDLNDFKEAFQLRQRVFLRKDFDLFQMLQIQAGMPKVPAKPGQPSNSMDWDPWIYRQRNVAVQGALDALLSYHTRKSHPPCLVCFASTHEAPECCVIGITPIEMRWEALISSNREVCVYCFAAHVPSTQCKTKRCTDLSPLGRACAGRHHKRLHGMGIGQHHGKSECLKCGFLHGKYSTMLCQEWLALPYMKKLTLIVQKELASYQQPGSGSVCRKCLTFLTGEPHDCPFPDCGVWVGGVTGTVCGLAHHHSLHNHGQDRHDWVPTKECYEALWWNTNRYCVFCGHLGHLGSYCPDLPHMNLMQRLRAFRLFGGDDACKECLRIHVGRNCEGGLLYVEEGAHGIRAGFSRLHPLLSGQYELRPDVERYLLLAEKSECRGEKCLCAPKRSI
jgi:hypothetical protein